MSVFIKRKYVHTRREIDVKFMVSLSQYSDDKVSNMCVLLSPSCGDWRVRDLVTVLVILPVMLGWGRGGPMLLFLGSAA